MTETTDTERAAEPDPRTHEQASDEAIHELRRRLAGYKS